jgi:hypothetical protein
MGKGSEPETEKGPEPESWPEWSGDGGRVGRIEE